MKKYSYSLYDSYDLPVLVTTDVQRLASYLGRSSMDSMKVTLSKYFKRKKQGLEAFLEDEKGNRYTIYRYDLGVEYEH